MYNDIHICGSIEKIRKLVEKINAQVTYSHQMQFLNVMKKAQMINA